MAASVLQLKAQPRSKRGLAHRPLGLRNGLWRVIEVTSAAHAHLIVGGYNFFALRASPLRLRLLKAPAQGRDSSQYRQAKPNQKPQKKRALLDLANNGSRQPAEDENHHKCHARS